MSDDTEEVVKVLYDYKYSDDTGQVEIKTGDIYRLIEKTNDEWWQVYDPSNENGDSFFVPAQYVKIVSEKSPWKAISDLDKVLTFAVKLDTSETVSETEEDGDNSSDSVFKESNGLEAKEQSCGESIDSDYANVQCKLPDLTDEGEYVNLDQFRDAAGIPILKSDSVHGSVETISPSNTLTDLSEASQELIHGSVPPPLPEEGKFIRVLMKDQPWDIYKENVLERLYFVNRETGERAWKPPRKVASPLDQLKPAQPEAVKLPDVSAPASNSSVQIKEEWSGIPSEYEQVHENGSVYFIHKATQDKWKTLVDKIGRQYFHKLGSSDTQWTLPTAPEVTDKENLLRSIEVPVQQRERRWEPAGHRLSTFGSQSSLRDKRAKSTYGQIETTASSRSATLPANLPSVTSMPAINERSQSTSTSQNSKRPGNIQTSNLLGPLQGLENVYEGYLYKTKIVDVSKKKVKKSWAQIYVVLQGSNLVFYKDQKSAAQKQGSPFGKPEAVVSLVGARVDLNPKELTSKKNTILLSASAGNVYLFQSENEKDNLEWFTRMKIIADDVSPIETSSRGFDTLDVQQKDDKRAEKGMVRKVSADDNSNLHSIDKNKNLVGIRAKLYNLISRRPTQEDLYKRGIIKDAVFGSKLNELCDREKVMVPNFVQRCIAAVESKGITHDGLYRVSGNLAEIQRLRCTVDTDDAYNLCDEQWDIHVLTGALKLFFRELKEPVFPFYIYDRFVDAIKKETRKDKLTAFKSAVGSLPPCNHATLKELFKHLCKVMDASHVNRMQTQNIAIVFGPTLLWQESAGEGLAVQTVYQSRIVEFILLEYSELFK